MKNKLTIDSIENIKNNFKDPISVIAMPQAIYNQVFRVDTKTGAGYILTIYHDRGFCRTWDDVLFLLSHLAQKHMKVPRLIHHNFHEQFHQGHGNHYSLAKHLPGHSVSAEHINDNHCYLAAHWLTSFHCQAIPARVLPLSSVLHQSMVRWLQYLLQSQNCQDNAQLLNVNLVAIQQALETINQNLNKYGEWLLPGWLHSDFFSGNVLFDSGNNRDSKPSRVTGVVDWEFAVYSYCCLDIFIGLHAWGFDVSGIWQPSKTQAWWRGVLTSLGANLTKTYIQPHMTSSLDSMEQLNLWRCLGLLACYRLLLMRLYNHHMLKQDIAQYERILQYYNQADLPHLEPWISFVGQH